MKSFSLFNLILVIACLALMAASQPLFMGAKLAATPTDKRALRQFNPRAAQVNARDAAKHQPSKRAENHPKPSKRAVYN